MVTTAAGIGTEVQLPTKFREIRRNGIGGSGVGVGGGIDTIRNKKKKRREEMKGHRSRLACRSVSQAGKNIKKNGGWCRDWVGHETRRLQRPLCCRPLLSVARREAMVDSMVNLMLLLAI